MSNQLVAAGSTARLGNVSGDLRVGRKATIMAESGGRVTVSGGAYFEGPVTIACDFECGRMRVEGKGFGPSGDVLVKGDLLAHGDLEIDASTEVAGTITAERVDIGGHLKSKGIASKDLRVGGHLDTRGSLKAGDVDVGGHLSVDEQLDISNLRVSGHTEIGGGTIRGDIKARGHFKSYSKLTFGTIQVYGHLTLPAGSTGDKLVASGKVGFEGDAFCRVMEINGVAEAERDCGAENLKVNGKLGVKGTLKVSEKFEVLGSVETKGVECGTLVVGGKLVTDRISTGQAILGGQVRTTRGLKAKEVVVGTGSRVNGPIVGEVVEVGKGLDLGGFWAQASSWRLMGHMTSVDDVYGREIRVDRYSQVKRIYAETIRMQSGSVADEVNYTKEVDISEGVRLEKPPRKLDRLPDAPL